MIQLGSDPLDADPLDVILAYGEWSNKFEWEIESNKSNDISQL